MQKMLGVIYDYPFVSEGHRFSEPNTESVTIRKTVKVFPNQKL